MGRRATKKGQKPSKTFSVVLFILFVGLLLYSLNRQKAFLRGSKIFDSATPEATEHFASLFSSHRVAGELFHVDYQGLTLSSLGVGTYLGNSDAETDTLVEDAISDSIERGWNVIDTAINYRGQKVGCTLTRPRTRRSLAWC